MAAFKYIPLSLSNTIKMTQAAFTVVLGYLWRQAAICGDAAHGRATAVRCRADSRD